VNTNVLWPVFIHSPYILEDRPVGENLSGMFGKAEQQIKLQRREANDLIANNDAMLGHINAEVSDNQSTLRLQIIGGLTPELSANPCMKLLNSKGLDDVVVGASIERFNLYMLVSAN
jgi:hypothetical protein